MIINNKSIEAKTKHYCDFCGGLITKGEHFIYQTVNTVYTIKSHIHCYELTKILRIDIDYEKALSKTFSILIEEIFFNSFTTPEKALLIYNNSKKESNNE